MSFQRLPDFSNLLCVPFRVFRDDDHHFMRAHISRRWMRVRYLAGTQIFRMLLDELNHAVASGLELRGSFSQTGESSSGPATFRGLHFAAAVSDYLQEHLFAIRRVG